MEIEENEKVNKKFKEQIELIEKEIAEINKLIKIYRHESPRLIKERDFLLTWAAKINSKDSK